MYKNCLKNLIQGILGLMLMNVAQAGIPAWTFTQVLGYPTSLSVSSTGNASVQYNVTNQSRKPHTLIMKPIPGVIPSGCLSPLGYHQSCTLTLAINGSGLQGDVLGGPVLCEQGNSNECYQPSQANILSIRLIKESSVKQFVVTSFAGSNGQIAPQGVQTVSLGSTLTFTATPSPGFGVSQWFVDGNIVQTGGTTYQLTNITANHTVNVTFDTVTLSSSVSTLGLSINCQPSSSCTTTQNAALTGNSRQITIQNTGSVAAENLSVNASNLPSGTTISSNTCPATLNAGASCVISLTPGSIASSDSTNTACTSGTQPVPSTLTVTPSNGPGLSISIYVLGYGCQYQGGFVYSINDTTPNTSSIGGKVASLVDQAAPEINTGPQLTSIIWSSNGNGSTTSDVDYATILGIDETSTTSTPSPTSPAYPSGTPPFIACNGSSDGACDSNNILSYYNFNRTSGGSAPTPLTYYAAGLCTATINTYSDWYLPAICEMDAVNTTVNCPSGAQSMLGSLSFLVGNPASVSPNPPSTSCFPPSGTDCLAGFYWSSTEFSGLPQGAAWEELFDIVGSIQNFDDKISLFGVRCSRDF